MSTQPDTEGTMTEKLNKPWMLAVWPGMGNVAIAAGYYLITKLGMNLHAEFQANELFDVENVIVKNGLIRLGKRPRNLLFTWKDPANKHDLVVFMGEAQPPLGKYLFCNRLMEAAKNFGVERVFTFAAMATEMRPNDPSRVFGAATDPDGVDELTRLELKLLEDGQIGGLNGVLLGVAAEHNLKGTCLLGEIPHIFSHLPFPKASLAVLDVFTTITGIELDVSELKEHAKLAEEQLTELLEQVEQSMRQSHEESYGDGEEEFQAEQPADQPQPSLSPDQREKIESLFTQAKGDRSKAFELKQVLDQLGVFKKYEDRFLDLFKKSDS